MKAKDLPKTRQNTRSPGDVLLKEFMLPLGLTASRLAAALHVTTPRITEIINARRGITAATALRLAKFFGTTGKFWLDLQAEYDLSHAEEKWTEIIDIEIRPLPGSKLTRTGILQRPGTQQKTGTQQKQRMRETEEKKEKDQKGKKQHRLSVSPKLTGNEKKVFDLLSDDLIDFDNLCYKSGLQAGPLAATITMLELSDLITVHVGGYFSRPVSRK